MPSKIIFTCLVLLVFQDSWSQQPNYTFKHFVRKLDTSEFKTVYPKKADGIIQTYVETGVELWDVDDDNRTYIRGSQPVLLCIEGQKKKDKREGVFSFYLIDSLNHSKKYKIWEEEYSNDRLNGQWRTYTLKGTLAKFDTFKDDSLNGVSRTYWIDGKKVWDEREYFNGSSKYLQRVFYDNGKVKEEVPFVDGRVTGLGKRYYEDGTIKEEAVFKDAKFDGRRKYYYPNGQVWIEEFYKEGKHWTVVANYTEKGEKRNPGTLKNGNGTLILYNEDGTVRETTSYQNGEANK